MVIGGAVDTGTDGTHCGGVATMDVTRAAIIRPTTDPFIAPTPTMALVPITATAVTTRAITMAQE
jgi:hypothetical protein